MGKVDNKAPLGIRVWAHWHPQLQVLGEGKYTLYIFSQKNIHGLYRFKERLGPKMLNKTGDEIKMQMKTGTFLPFLLPGGKS